MQLCGCDKFGASFKLELRRSGLALQPGESLIWMGLQPDLGESDLAAKPGE